LDDSNLFADSLRFKLSQFHCTICFSFRRSYVLAIIKNRHSFNSEINQVEHTKFLGLIIDENLSWDNHINHVVNKMSAGLYAMRQMYKICSSETLLTVYYSLVHSHLAYGISLYGGTTTKNLKRILLQQKRAIRIMFNLKRKDSVKNFFTNLEIFTVFGLYIFETIIYVKKEIIPADINGKIHSYNTRFNRHVDQHNLEFYKKKTSFIGKQFFYHLPKCILNEKIEKVFKKKLRDFLLKLAPYSFEEFWEYSQHD
jgi:hypothetical protein